jgi:hypothetical protein
MSAVFTANRFECPKLEKMPLLRGEIFFLEIGI